MKFSTVLQAILSSTWLELQFHIYFHTFLRFRVGKWVYYYYVNVGNTQIEDSIFNCLPVYSVCSNMHISSILKARDIKFGMYITEQLEFISNINNYP